MTRNLKLGLAFAGLTFLGACGSASSHGGGGGGGGAYDTFADKALSGKVGGKDWTFVSGRASKGFKDGEVMFELWNEQVDNPCNAWGGGSNYKVFASVDKKTGEVTMGNTDNVTLAYEADGTSNNVIVTSGAYELTEIADDHIAGRIRGFYDDGHAVNGTFTVPYCAGYYKTQK